MVRDYTKSNAWKNIIKARQLIRLRQQLKDVEAWIDNFELDPDDYEDQYDEMLDSEGPVEIGGPGITFDPSAILKELDPIAYRTGLLDYIDSLGPEDDENYQQALEERDILEDEIEELED